jgi:DNA-binding winged helix-turn-helix (wHTH) protein
MRNHLTTQGFVTLNTDGMMANAYTEVVARTTVPEKTPDGTRLVTNSVYRFGEFEVRSESGELFRDSARVRVQEQSFQVLLALLEKPGTVVSRDEMRERLWPEGTHVDFEHSLNAAVKRLRAALEDEADHPHYIETLPKRGYRLMVEVTSPNLSGIEDTPAVLSPEAGPRLVPNHRLRKHLRLAIGLAILLLMAAAAVTLTTRHMQRGARFNTNPSVGTVTAPANGEAYELYLRSLAYKPEPPDNVKAIGLLERSTVLEPASSRSWYELSRRYHFEYLPGGRGQRYLQQAREANWRALELAPDFSSAKLHQVMLDVEAGQLGPAYHAALTMSRARPQDGNAHFALSYVLRFGGMFKESAEECDLALKVDPDNATFRSCSMAYLLLGRYDRAAAVADLDPLSMYARFRKIELALLVNDKTAALNVADSMRLDPPNEYPEARLMEAVLNGAPQSTVLNWSRESEALYDRINHSEAYFVAARYQSWAGQTEPALRLLRRAISNSYCSYPVIDSDPFFANIRQLPEYKQLRESGIACRNSFRAQMLDGR